ncbi:MAG: peptidylprolyl isomerase [Verrucomicrobiota bacterium]|nr:peptidylprolyl isomerase [Verrucomicrobiota bacterium]
MSKWSIFKRSLAATICFLAACSILPLFAAAPLFEDKILAKGKGVEVRSSQVEEALIAFKANRAASGQPVPRSQEKAIEKEILDRLISTQLFLARAKPEDEARGKEMARKFIEENKSKAPSEAAFYRQIRAGGLTPEQFVKQVEEQAVVKAVIDRELKSKVNITAEDMKKFEAENPSLFVEPEQLRASHIHLSFKDPITKEPLSGEARAAKKKLIEELRSRALKGEDFAKLAREHSEDANSKEKGGEYKFSKGQMPPEFEAAAFSLKPDQLSEVVTTRYGYHIIKLHERIDSGKIPLKEVEEKVREIMVQKSIQAELPKFLEQLRKEAELVETP